MTRLTLVLAFLSLCTWLLLAAEASGPGEPFRLCAACWCIVLIVGVVIVFAIGFLLGRQRRP